MLTIEKTETYGWEAAIRGMCNPMNSWEKSDSLFGKYYDLEFPYKQNNPTILIDEYGLAKYIGDNDLCPECRQSFKDWLLRPQAEEESDWVEC